MERGFVMGGGGGFVGTVQNGARDSVNRGYATVGTDTGHQSPAGHLAGWHWIISKRRSTSVTWPFIGRPKWPRR